MAAIHQEAARVVFPVGGGDPNIGDRLFSVGGGGDGSSAYPLLSVSGRGLPTRPSIQFPVGVVGDPLPQLPCHVQSAASAITPLGLNLFQSASKEFKESAASVAASTDI